MKAILIAIVVAAAIVVALVLAPFAIPTAPYEKLVVDTLVHRTGGEVTVGSLRISFLPYLSYTIRDVELPVGRIERIRGTFSLTEVVKKRLATDVTIEGLDLTADTEHLLATLAVPKNGDPLAGWQIVVKSLRISSGHIRGRIIDELKLSKIVIGPQLSGSFDFESPSMKAKGQFFFDRPNFTFYVRDGTISIAGITSTLDAAFALQSEPLTFEIHGATAAATLQQLSSIFAPFKDGFPAGISWTGPAAIDLFLSGSAAQTAIHFQAELTQSEVVIGDAFSKQSGIPLKIGFDGINLPAHVKINALNARTGESTIQINGLVSHQPGHQAQLNVHSSGFTIVDLKPLLPLLTPFESLTGATAQALIHVSLDQPAQRTSWGNMTAESASIMGTPLDALKIDFHQQGDRTILPLVSARAYGGNLSANGTVERGNDTRYSLQAILEDFDTQAMPRLGQSIRGRGTIVADITVDGGTISATGTLVAKDASAPTLAIGTALLGMDTWNTIDAELEDIRLEVKGLETLGAIDPTINVLHATFSLRDDVTTITDLRCLNPHYTLWTYGTLDTQGSLNTTGSIWLNRATTTNLISSSAVRRKITNSVGQLQIPFMLKGRGDSLVLRLEPEELKRLAKGASIKAPRIAGAPSTDIEPVVDEEKAEVQPKPKATKKTPTRRTQRSSPSHSIPSSQSDDILKVHIR